MTTCARLWEVEAERDGRIAGEERASAERHQRGCGECSRERDRLIALGRDLRATEVTPLDALSLRRVRADLLAEADRSGTGVQRRLKPRVALGLAMAAVCAVLGGGLVASRTIRSEGVVVAPVAGAQWSRRAESERSVVTLEAGTLAVRVTRGHVRVVTPDADIDDVGTAFSVTVEQARTTRVAVSTGRVIVRWRDGSSKELGASESWEVPAVTATMQVPLEAPLVEPPPPQAPERRSETARSGQSRVPRAPQAAGEPSLPTGPSTPSPIANDDPATVAFDAGMAQLRQGRPSDAAATFEQFGRLHADHPRAEDAAYLRVLALARAGRRAAASAAAKAYLARYPSGFRAADVAALVQ